MQDGQGMGGCGAVGCNDLFQFVHKDGSARRGVCIPGVHRLIMFWAIRYLKGHMQELWSVCEGWPLQGCPAHDQHVMMSVHLRWCSKQLNF